MSHERPLAGRVALVTGGTRGIGAAIALELATAGARTCVNARHSDAASIEVIERIRAAGGEAVFVSGDVTDEQSARLLVQATQAAFERIDIVVNNVGEFFLSPVE